jgi:hypothetical protein
VCAYACMLMCALYVGGCAHAFLQTIYCGYNSANVGTKWGKEGQKAGELGCNFNPHIVCSAVQLLVL